MTRHGREIDMPRILFVLLAGCAAPLPKDFAEDLVDQGACGDIQFYAASEGGSRVLEVYAWALVADAVEAGEPVTTVEENLTEISVNYREGYRVTSGLCRPYTGDSHTENSWWGASGRAEITITPDTTGQGRHGAHVLLEDVEFRNTYDNPAGTLDDFEIDAVLGQ